MKKLSSTHFGSKLYELRKKKRLTQNGLAKLVGVSGGAISQFESGKSLPSLESMDKLYNVLGFNFIDFYNKTQFPLEIPEEYEQVFFIPISEYPWFENFAKWYKIWSEQGEDEWENNEEWWEKIITSNHTSVLRLPNINYLNAFVVEIKGNSMAPRYPHGSHYVAMLINDLKYSTGVHLFCFHSKSLFIRRIISNKEGVLTLKADATGEESTLQLDEINKLREEGLFMALKLGQAAYMPPEE